MKKTIAVLIVVGAAALVWFWSGHRPAPASVAPPPKVVKEEATGKQSPAGRSHDTTRDTTSKEDFFGDDAFVARFGLTDTEAWDLSSGTWRAALEVFEEKGRGARVVNFEGKSLTLFVPGLKYRPGQIEEVFRKVLFEAVAPEKAGKAWADLQARRYLLSNPWIARAAADSLYHFTRVADATFDEVGTRIDYPMFTIDFEHGASRDLQGRASKRETWHIENFTFSDMDSHGLSWTALAKAPLGYFRDEPIGEPPPRQAGIVVIRDIDTGKVEIRNLRYPGSKDFDQIEPEVSTTP